jgi:rhomboid family GlyGly-CTERM serine protease
MLRRAPVTFALGGICLLLACAGEPAAAGLGWERAAILQGELWRLLSGHLVHFSFSHAGADLLALMAMGTVAEPLAGSRRFAKILAGGAVLMSLGLLALAPELNEYRGASGLATLAAALGGVLAWRRHPVSRPMLACAALALASKTLWEAFAHMAAFTDLPAGVAVAWQAHLLGALLGGWAASVIDSPPRKASHGSRRHRAQQ